MYRYLPIRNINAREIIDSRGNPTVEVEVTVGEGIVGINGSVGRAMVPSGASTGRFEAVEKRDGEEEWFEGKGVGKAVQAVNEMIADELTGENALCQTEIDRILCQIDGTENKSQCGANALLGVSMAVAKAAASGLHLPLFRYLGGIGHYTLPMPMMNILNGGCHAANHVDLQEFMIVPIGSRTYREGLEVCCNIYHRLKQILQENHLSTGVGDEGGFAPDLKHSKEVLQYITQAVEACGYRPGEDVAFAIDAAASELYQDKQKTYYFEGESAYIGESVIRGTEEMIAYYQKVIDQFPIVSIEDPLCEDDWEGWQKITQALGDQVQLVGDDLFVTNTQRLCTGIKKKAGNAILIKPNQIGTVTETIDAILMAKEAGYRTIISHRSGETEDTFIADLSVAFHTGQIKTGAPCRAERTAKYNQLLRIEEEIGCIDTFLNPFSR